MQDFATRNYFNHSHYRVQTFDTGILTPIFCRDVLPGDTWSEKTDIEIRAYIPPATPLMHEVYLKTYYFYVPNRIMWNDQMGAVSDRRPGFENFRTRGFDGKDNTTSPGFTLSSTGTFSIEPESILDYLGYPLELSSSDFYSTLPLRACAMIWNHYFRDQDLQEPFPVDVSSVQESSWPNWWKDIINTNYPWTAGQSSQGGPDQKSGNLRINWEKDYFTSARPFAQKGDPTTLPLGSIAPLTQQYAPVIASGYTAYTPISSSQLTIQHVTGPAAGWYFAWIFTSGQNYSGNLYPDVILDPQGNPSTITVPGGPSFITITSGSTYTYTNGFATGGQITLFPIWTYGGGTPFVVSQNSVSGSQPTLPAPNFSVINVPSNSVDLSSVFVSLTDATAAHVNDQRWAFQDQIMKEINMRGGNRIDEFYANHYKVKVQDERIQQPEFLSMGRSPIIFSEVLNQTSTTDSSPLGSFGGHAITASRSREFTRTFHEDGWIIGFAVVIPRTQYHQGIHRQFTRRSPYDYHLPVFNHTGEQPVYIRELYAQSEIPDEVFGYQGRYDEYRRTENSIHGLLHTNLYYWSWARDFSSQPSLNSEFITCYPQGQESSPFVDTSTSPWIGLVINHAKAVRALPKRAQPGFIDHR